MALSVNAADANLIAHFPMELKSGQISESISGERFAVEGNFAPENVPGVSGNALRFDGYTSHVNAGLRDIIPADSKQLTISVWVALPCYPIVQIDNNTSEKTAIVTCLDDDSKSGFGFYVGFNGKYSFRCYIGGWPINIDIESPLALYEWNNLVAVIDGSSRTAKLYNNGVEVGSSRANGSISFKGGALYMGQSKASRLNGPFELMSFNGLVDEFKIWDEAISVDEIKSWKTQNSAILDIPDSRFENDLLRPRFHGMPDAGWTNESHGMFYSDGRYHVFFQKNADGPYMARLHWGHISSENLYEWREEKIALTPGDWFDIKGCWSGCVFADEVITGGKPNILYTAVDYGKAMIAQASTTDDSLVEWKKNVANPIISARPVGLSDDFRDPYFFRNGENAYIIVGSSKNGVGTTTLHRYNPASGIWSNNGDLFFTGSSASADGVFWEMPNVTNMGSGKWLFTATPLATMSGVRTLYRVGSISDDGKFIPDSNSESPRLVELNSRDGYGLLSPTIYQHNGKTIALGIVPDKLPSSSNWNLGWAHCYSLPREWSLSENGTLLQKPFDGLNGLRSHTLFNKTNFDLNGELSLSPVSGRSVEILANFVVGSNTFGFNIFKNGNARASISYNPSSAELIVDFSSLPRLINDAGVYDGVYRCSLPERPVRGSNLKLNIFIDHSILDIFVNDKYATSIRVFPTDKDSNDIDVFANGSVSVNSIDAWVLDSNSSSIDIVESEDKDMTTSVYNLEGMLIRENVAANVAVNGLPSGFYIVGNKRVFVSK